MGHSIVYLLYGTASVLWTYVYICIYIILWVGEQEHWGSLLFCACFVWLAQKLCIDFRNWDFPMKPAVCKEILSLYSWQTVLFRAKTPIFKLPVCQRLRFCCIFQVLWESRLRGGKQKENPFFSLAFPHFQDFCSVASASAFHKPNGADG